MMISAVLKMLDDLGVPEEMIMFDDFGRKIYTQQIKAEISLDISAFLCPDVTYYRKKNK